MPGEHFHLVLELAFAAAHDGSQDHDSISRRELHDTLDDLLGRLLADGFSAVGAVGSTDQGIQSPQVVIDLRDRAHGRAGTAGRSLLLDGDRWAQTVNGVDVRTFHAVKKLTGIGREGF